MSLSLTTIPGAWLAAPGHHGACHEHHTHHTDHTDHTDHTLGTGTSFWQPCRGTRAGDFLISHVTHVFDDSVCGGVNAWRKASQRAPDFAAGEFTSHRAGSKVRRSCSTTYVGSLWCCHWAVPDQLPPDKPLRVCSRASKCPTPYNTWGGDQKLRHAKMILAYFDNFWHILNRYESIEFLYMVGSCHAPTPCSGRSYTLSLQPKSSRHPPVARRYSYWIDLNCIDLIEWRNDFKLKKPVAMCCLNPTDLLWNTFV